MRELRRLLAVFAAGAFAFALAAHGQDDSPSLGDVARQSRMQKQQQDATAGKDGASKDSASQNSGSKDGGNNGQTTAAPTATSKAVPGKDAQGKPAPSLDAAAKDAPPAKTAKRVITNDEIPQHIGPTRTSMSSSSSSGQPVYYPQPGSAGQGQAEALKGQILAMKESIANYERQIDELNSSIQYAGGNCVSGCVQWNERQKQKQDQVEVMKGQLEQMRKHLEDVQEMCRKQGYGSSVYDP